jgi:nucleoporin NDC1
LNDAVAVPGAKESKTEKSNPGSAPPTLYSKYSSAQSPKAPRPLVAPLSKEKASENNNKIQTVKNSNGNALDGVKARFDEFLSKSPLASYPVKFLKAVRDKFSNNALFSSAPDAGTRSVFAESQIIIWAVEGLSYLISSSILEDRYGVVQKDLPRVISCLFVLQKTVDKHKGVTISSKKNRLETRDLQLKQELRAALKSSIYRIISTYGDHLDSLPLPTEHQKKINNYKHFQE